MEDGATSHAMMGEIWLNKHLAKAGKSIEQLASRLWKDNLTAVAEVSHYQAMRSVDLASTERDLCAIALRRLLRRARPWVLTRNDRTPPPRTEQKHPRVRHCPSP